MKKLSIMCLFGALSMLASCSSGPKTLAEIQKSGKLIVTTNAEFAPFEYKEGSTLKGIDIDIINAYGEYIGVEVEIQDIDFDSALISVSKNKSDVAIAAITKNEKREETLSFSDSYFAANQVVIVKEDSVYASLTTEEEIMDKLSENNAKVGCQRGTTGQFYIEGDADWGFDGIANSECVTFDNGALAVTALSNGQIDAVVIDQLPAEMYCEKIDGVTSLDVVLTQEEYAIAVSKGNESLVNSLNEFISEIKEDGTLEQIVSKYYGE